MILSQTAEYAIRAVVTLALLENKESTTATEIAKNSQVPQSYLSKILRQLVESKVLIAKKGTGGGFSFAKPLSEINLLEVLTAVSFELDLNHCPFGWEKCGHKNPCPLHASYSKLKQSYLEWAENTTVASIAKNPEAKFQFPGNSRKKGS